MPSMALHSYFWQFQDEPPPPPSSTAGPARVPEVKSWQHD